MGVVARYSNTGRGPCTRLDSRMRSDSWSQIGRVQIGTSFLRLNRVDDRPEDADNPLINAIDP